MKAKLLAPIVLSWVALIVGLGSSYVSGMAEESVLVEGNTVQRFGKTNALEIKGRTYFVSDDQKYRYEAGRDVFVGSVLTLGVSVSWMKSRSKEAS